MRALALLSGLLFIYLIVQIYRAPASLRNLADKLQEMTSDPNLERETIDIERQFPELTALQPQTSLKVVYGERTNMEPTIQMRRE